MKVIDYLQNWHGNKDVTVFAREGSLTTQGRNITYIVDVVNLATGLTRETRKFPNDYSGAMRFAKLAAH